MPSHKSQRTAEDIKRELAVVMQGVKDPRVKGKILTVVRVHVSSDSTYAKVYISDLAGLEGAKEAAAALNNAAGFLRGEIARNLHLRKAKHTNGDRANLVVALCDELSLLGDDIDDAVDDAAQFLAELKQKEEAKTDAG